MTKLVHNHCIMYTTVLLLSLSAIVVDKGTPAAQQTYSYITPQNSIYLRHFLGVRVVQEVQALHSESLREKCA